MNKFEAGVSPFALFRQQNNAGGPIFRGPVIKLNHTNGQWFRETPQGPVPIPIGTKVVVNPCALIDTWTKYGPAGVKPVTTVYRVSNFELAPPREEMGDTDQKRWPVAGKDPLARAAYLPMLLEGGIVAFKATGQAALGEIGSFCEMYDLQDRKGLLPVAGLESRPFEGKGGSTVFAPVLHLVDWAPWENGLLVQQPVRRLASEIEAQKTLPAPPSFEAPDEIPDGPGEDDESLPF